MKSNHTPGPWHVFENNHCRWISNHTGKCSLAFIIHPAGMTTETVNANARLLASAPELLEALEAILSPLFDDEIEECPQWKQAKEAIAKAKGQA